MHTFTMNKTPIVQHHMILVLPKKLPAKLANIYRVLFTLCIHHWLKSITADILAAFFLAFDIWLKGKWEVFLLSLFSQILMRIHRGHFMLVAEVTASSQGNPGGYFFVLNLTRGELELVSESWNNIWTFICLLHLEKLINKLDVNMATSLIHDLGNYWSLCLPFNYSKGLVLSL